MAISEMRYTPSPEDVALYVLPVAVPLTVTDAPLTAAPVLSSTDPAMAPRSDCATAAPDSNMHRKPNVSAGKNDFIFTPLQSLQNISHACIQTLLLQQTARHTKVPLIENN